MQFNRMVVISPVHRLGRAHYERTLSVEEATAASVRQVCEASGEFSAVVELRRHFTGITNNETARLCVRAISSWKPLPGLPPKRNPDMP